MTQRPPQNKPRTTVEPGRRHEPAMFDREREVRRMRGALERLESPRLQMMGIVALTGCAGFLASYLLLMGGMHAMWLRYPIATAIAYLVFLALLWLWLLVSDRDETSANALDVGSDVAMNADTGGYASKSHGPDFDHDVGGIDFDEAALIAVAIAAVVAVVAALWAMFAIVGAAPMLLAEIVVDAALAGGLYRRVRSIDRGRHWLRTAIARTVWRFAAVAALFGVIGALIAWAVPGADSFGDLWRR